jgi:hypothetical protein
MRDDVHFPLVALETHGVVLPQLADKSKQYKTLTAISSIRRILIDKLRKMIEGNYRGIQECLLKLLVASEDIGRSLGEQPSRAKSIPYRAIQVVYGALLSEGYTLDLSPKPSTKERNACKDLYALVQDIVALSNIITLGRRRLRSLSLAHGSVISSTTDIDDAFFELAQNIAVEPGLDTDPLSVVMDKYVSEAERTIFGWKLSDLLQISNKEWSLNTEDGLVILDLSRAPTSDLDFISRLTLTADRLRSFGAPYFLDLAPPLAAKRNRRAMVEDAAAMMWLPYYPFLQARAVGQDVPSVAVTTPELLSIAMLAAANSKAYRLNRLSQFASETYDVQGRTIVQALTRHADHNFEKLVSQALEGEGLTATSSISAIDGETLPSGEIDVLAGGVGCDGQPILFVCEAKNVDLALMKNSGYDHLATTMAKAAKQVAQKADWARSSWPQCASFVNLPPTVPPITVGLIVTRRPVPFPLIVEWPGGTVAEARLIVRDALSQPRSLWRRDVLKGIVGEESDELAN